MLKSHNLWLYIFLNLNSIKTIQEGSEEGATGGVETGAEEEMMATAGSDEMIQVCSEEMESDIQRILEKIDRFTQQVILLT